MLDYVMVILCKCSSIVGVLKDAHRWGQVEGVGWSGEAVQHLARGEPHGGGRG